MEKDIELIQKYLMERLEKLNNDTYMRRNSKNEISRSNTVANTALTYIKVVNLKLKVESLSNKHRKLINEATDQCEIL